MVVVMEVVDVDFDGDGVTIGGSDDGDCGGAVGAADQ